MIALLLALAGTAQANEIDAWVELYDGILAEAADNDVDNAVRTYQGLARTLGADAPLRGIALYWLGRALESDDDAHGARDALRECVRAGNARTRCLDLLGRIELESSAVRRIPTRWTLEDGNHGFVHPWMYNETGSIRLRPNVEDHGQVLVWATTISSDLDDQLLLGFVSPTPAPHGLRFDIRASNQDATLRIVVFDVAGHRFLSANSGLVQTLPNGEWQQFDMSLTGLQALEGGSSMVPSEIDHIVLQDLSAQYGAPSGPNELWLDNIVIY